MPELPPALLHVHALYGSLPRDVNGRSLPDQYVPTLELAGITHPVIQRRCARMFQACDSEAATVRAEEMEEKRKEREAARR